MWQVEISPGKRPLYRHQHMNFEIMLVNQGSGTYVTEHASYPILPGHVFVFSSNEFHCITDVGKHGLVITNLQFDPHYIQGTSQESLSVPNFCFSHQEAFQNCIPSEKADALTQLFLQLQEELISQSPEFHLAVRSLLNLFLIRLLRDFPYKPDHSEFRHEHQQTIARVISYLDTHFCEKITLPELSRIAGLTPNYFCTLFKQLCGITLWDYINTKRIDKAISLLNQDRQGRTILHIAEECGFHNTANFNKTFKKSPAFVPANTAGTLHR